MEPQRNNSFENPANFGGNFSIDQSPNNIEKNNSLESIDKNRNIQESRENLFAVADKIKNPTPPPVAGISNNQPVTSDIAAANVQKIIPSTAKDIELMEDEWVKSLKSMLQQTKGDPHLREYEFKKMQVEYLLKRYGRKIKEGSF